MVNTLHRKIRVNDGFGVSKVVAGKEHGKPPIKFEDAELEALLNEDDSKTQKQLA